MPTQATTSMTGGPGREGPEAAAWRMLGFINGLRLLVALVLAALFVGVMPLPQGRLDPALSSGAATAYLLYALVCAAGIWRRIPDPAVQTWSGVFADVMVLTLLTYAGELIKLGLAALLVLSVGAAGFILPRGLAVSVGAVAAALLLGQALYAADDSAALSLQVAPAAIFGALVIAAVFCVTQIVQQLRRAERRARRATDKLKSNVGLHLQLAGALREAVIIVDAEDRIGFISEQAALRLMGGEVPPRLRLDDVSPALAELLARWREGVADDALLQRSFDGLETLQLRLSPLEGERFGTVMISVEERHPPAPASPAAFAPIPPAMRPAIPPGKSAVPVQLASAVASPASTYPAAALPMNMPLGAALMAGAPVSLPGNLARSVPGTPRNARPPEARFTDDDPRLRIIIGGAVQVGRRPVERAQQFELGSWCKEFLTEFWPAMQIGPQVLQLRVTQQSVFVNADPAHLHRLLWKLCDDLLKYARNSTAEPVEIRIARSKTTRRCYLDVIDRGRPADPGGSRAFEPFLAVGQVGPEINLYVSRELQSSSAKTLRPGGGVVFRLVFG